MRKRSKYKPKGVRLDNLSWVKAVLQKVGTLPKAGVGLKIKNHIALEAVIKGEGTKDSIDELIAAFNIAEALYKINPDLGLDYAPEIKAAQDAIFSLGKRFLSTQKIAFTGPEMIAVRHAMEIHDVQLDECNVREMEKAIDLVNATILNRNARPIVEQTCKQLMIHSTTPSPLKLQKQKKNKKNYETNGELTGPRSWAGQSAIMEAIERAQDESELENGLTGHTLY